MYVATTSTYVLRTVLPSRVTDRLYVTNYTNAHTQKHGRKGMKTTGLLKSRTTVFAMSRAGAEQTGKDKLLGVKTKKKKEKVS